jgi:hypothetical protein
MSEMSDIENPQGSEELNSVPPAPATPAEPVAVSEAAFGDVHTPANTPMKKVLPVQDTKLREGTDEDRAKGYLPFFLGNTRVDQEQAQKLLGRWLQKQAVLDLYKSGQVGDGVQAVAKNEWSQYLEESYPNKTLEEMEDLASNLYRFFEDFQDNVAVRSKILNEPDVANVSDRGSKIVTPDIVGKRPSNSSKGFSVSELMRRSSIRAEKGDFQFDVLLRDSYTNLTFIRPSKLDLAGLVSDINRTVKGYVRTVGENSISLAYIAGARAVWEFLAPRIVSSSVTGIVDFNELARVIRLKDFGVLCMALIRATHANGINLDLRCLSDKCDWHEFQISDPDRMVRIRHSAHTPEDYAIYANLLNGKAKYTVEETLELIMAATYNLDTNRVYNEDKSICLEIGSPSLAEAFETFDYYAGRVNPQLAELRSKIVDQQEFETQVGMLLATLGATEYLHWVRAFINVATPDTDEKDIVLKRSEHDSTEFNKGLMDVILESAALNKAFSAFVLNKTPLMSHTFVGVANSQCPKCGEHSSANEQSRRLGYTPLDPFMAFFTLTQLKMMAQASEAQAARQEAISE